MDTELWIALDKDMHMIGHDFQLDDLCLMLLAHLSNDVFHAFCYVFYEHFAPIFGTKDHMIFARVVHIPVRFVCYCTHGNSIQHQAIYCQAFTLPYHPSHLKRNAPSNPTAEAESFTGRLDNEDVEWVCIT